MTPNATEGETAAGSEERVAAALDALGLEGRLLRFGEGETRTSEQAAAAVGCELGQVVKSLVLMAGTRPVLALVAGDRRADLAAVAAELGAKRAWFASPDEVREATGYEVGGVSPFDLPAGLAVLADDSLSRFGELFPAGGSDRAMVRISLAEMLETSGARLAPVSREA